MVGPAAQRDAVTHLKAVMGLSERRGCPIISADRKMIRYPSWPPPEGAARAELRELGDERRPFGNARWSVDFVHDQFACGRRFRILNVVDDVTRECLAAIPDTSISGRRVARELTKLIAQRGKPGMIVSDHGTEFTSNVMLAWAQSHQVVWQFIAPR